MAKRSRRKSKAKSKPKGGAKRALTWVVVLGLLGAFFFYRHEGETGFSRVLAMLAKDPDAVEKPTRGQPEVARDMHKAEPLEKVTDDEQAGLDDLIKSKSAN